MQELSINYVDDYLKNTLNRNIINSEKERISSLDIFVKWNYQDSRAKQFRSLLEKTQKLLSENNSGTFLNLILLRKLVEPHTKSQRYLFHKSKIFSFLLENGVKINSQCSDEKYHDLQEIEFYSIMCKITNDDFESIHRILELLPYSFIVASKTDINGLSKSSLLIQRLQQKDDWWFSYSSLNSILFHEKNRFLIRLHGSFDDPESSLICIGKSESIRSIK